MKTVFEFSAGGGSAGGGQLAEGRELGAALALPLAGQDLVDGGAAAAAGRARLAATSHVCALTRHENSIREARKKRDVLVISYRTGNPDPQNMMLGADKLVADNLVKMGVLVDDSKKWCKLDAEPRRAGKEGIRTVIEIREE